MQTSDRGAARIVDRLVRAGASHLFGFPGESSLPLYAATQGTPELRHVMAVCERCAGYMADGYARLSGTVGICDSPGGVGTPWLVPALHEAWASAVPMLAVTTAPPARDAGRWPTTHCANDRLFDSVAKQVLRLTRADRVGELVDRALTLAVSGRPGPVVLDVDPGLLSSPAPGDETRTAAGAVTCPAGRPRPDRDGLAAAARLLLAAERPLLVVGGGIHASAGYRALEELVRAHGLPVATTFNGKGAVAESGPHWLGVVGAKGHPRANAEAARATAVVWLASKAGDKSTLYGKLPPPEAAAVHVDIDPEALGRTFPVRIGLAADAAAFLEDLAAELASQAPGWRAAPWTADAGAAEPGDSGEWSSRAIVTAVRARVPEPLVVADASKASSWVGVHHRVDRPGRSVIAPRGSGSIGYALPAAIGAAFAAPGAKVVAVTGDGGFAMACHELPIAVTAGLDLAVVILDNRSLGLLEQVGRHKLRPDFALPGAPGADWTAVARGYGCRAARVDSVRGLAGELDAWAERGGVLVLDALVPAAESSPDFEMFKAGSAAAW